jgi:hypothetical protein
LRPRVAACVLAALCAGSGLAWGQQEASFRVDVDLVLLHVAVIDPGGGEIPPLTEEDFSVYDDGVPQDIDLFVTPMDAPIDVAMVLDSSASMKPVETSARRAALTFLNKMGLDDCIYALPFADSSGPGRWGRSGDPQLRGFIGSIRSDGGTAWHDAVLAGLAELERANANDLVELASDAEEGPPAQEERVETPAPEDANEAVAAATPESAGDPADAQQPPSIVLPPRRTSLLNQVDSAIRDLDLSTPPPTRGCGEPLPPGASPDASNARRRALILLSDGADMDSKAGFYDALGAARAASVPVFPVAMGYANSEPGLKENLAELARATGGRLIESTRPGELASAYDEVVALLRTYYLIGYDPDGAAPARASDRPRWHDVRVELRRPNFEALVRPGYYR